MSISEHLRECIKVQGWSEELASKAADELDTLKELLRKVEWSPRGEHDDLHCPLCENWKPDGHKPDCRLKLFLEDHK